MDPEEDENQRRQSLRGRLRYKVDEMAERGRRPSFDARGNIDGFRSRPGAPQAAGDNMTNLTGMVRPAGGGLSDPKAWGSFFKGNSPEGVKLGYAATNPSIFAASRMGRPAPAVGATPAFNWRTSGAAPSLLTDPKAFATGNRTGNTADSYLGNVIAGASNFFKKRGMGLDDNEEESRGPYGSPLRDRFSFRL